MRADDRVDGLDFKRALVLSIALLLTILLWGVEALADEAPQRVLILHAYNYTFPSTAAVSDAFRKALEEYPKRIEIEADFLDLGRHSDAAHALGMANFLHDKYANLHFDAVVMFGFGGVPFLLKYRDIIAPGVPAVLSDAPRSAYDAMRLPPDITAVINDFHIDKSIELAEHLQPHARRLVVIGGSTNDDKRLQDIARIAIKAYNSPKLETSYWFDRSYNSLLEDVSRLPDDTIVLLLTFLADSENKRFVPRDVAAAIAKASSAPVYGFYETFLGSGIVGGYVTTYQAIGTTAAAMVMEILAGKDVTRIPPRASPSIATNFRVDARAMKRWGLEQTNLPPGSTVLFHQPSLWEQHRLLVSATAAVVALQSSVVAGLLFQRRRRRQAENSLRDSEDRMTFAAVSASIGLWQFDRATEELWAAEPCRAILGFDKDTRITLEGLLSAVHSDDRNIATDILQRSKGEASAPTDIRIVHPNGEQRWVRIRAQAYADGPGAQNQLSGMFVDVTEQKTAESEAELQRQEVAHLTRVTVMGELSGAIAHEVNQPLTAILSNAQAALHLLAPESPNFDEIHGALEDIVQEDNRAGDIILRLRGLLKKGESKFESVDLNKLIEATIALLRHEVIARRVSIEPELAPGLPPVLGDPIQLQQILLNLFMNAMDAMASIPDAQRQINIWTRVASAGIVEVCLRDRGPGIEPTDSKRVFVPFYTTKERGLGLGLSICSTIIEKHGGKIELRNYEGGGALAAFSLPGS